MKRVKKDGLRLLIMDYKSCASYQLINFFLILFRYNLIYSNIFYKLNILLSILMSIPGA
jgi:hypothetical protein